LPFDDLFELRSPSLAGAQIIFVKPDLETSFERDEWRNRNVQSWTLVARSLPGATEKMGAKLVYLDSNDFSALSTRGRSRAIWIVGVAGVDQLGI
jgi:hypothetical protein